MRAGLSGQEFPNEYDTEGRKDCECVQSAEEASPGLAGQGRDTPEAGVTGISAFRPYLGDPHEHSRVADEA